MGCTEGFNLNAKKDFHGGGVIENTSDYQNKFRNSGHMPYRKNNLERN